MKSLLFAALLSSPLCAAADAPSGRAIDMAEVYRLSLARSEHVAQSGETYQEVLAKADELWSSVLPRISLMGTETLQQVPQGASNLFLQGNREQGWVTAHQPLFSGLREFLSYRASKDLGRSAQLQLERAKHLLYQDAARAYLDLLSAQDEISIRETVVDNTEDRVKDLREFRRLGRARASELLAAESQLAQNLAALETSRAREAVAQFKLGFLTGLDERLAPKPIAQAASAPDLLSVLTRARQRSDVAARRADLEASELSIKVVSRRRWPSFGLDANYYFQRPPGFTSNVKWDATITGSLPLYAGGEISAQVRQQEAQLRSKRLALSETERTAELEVKSAYRDLLSSAAVVAALEKAAQLAEANAKAQAEDYRLGQVTNLDVLGSLNTLQQTRLQLDTARLDAYWSRVRLETAAGSPGDDR
ncbi:MAG TPA: hypothetical protein DCZ01_07820 [Elusimicrobia bacterium]|nr:MAG: hypothetical protein A2X37_01205 [Elusimicrobia bacterium GWA2_66_18]OGR75972.1 MAG: hypothetical protein A2X40_08490 [Elusimicrobia bacterium GWC2_65_9]HAZ08412.1 hypothetical protein [Elusimicrobiota bacterium]